jgi:hypothetical protein
MSLVISIRTCGTCIRSSRYPLLFPATITTLFIHYSPRSLSVKLGRLLCDILSMRSHIAAVFGLASLTPALAAPGFIQQNTASINASRAGPSNTREVPLPSGTTAPLGGSGASSYHSPAFLPFGDILGSQTFAWASSLGTLQVRSDQYILVPDCVDPNVFTSSGSETPVFQT